VCCSVLQRVAACCTVLQRVAPLALDSVLAFCKDEGMCVCVCVCVCLCIYMLYVCVYVYIHVYICDTSTRTVALAPMQKSPVISGSFAKIDLELKAPLLRQILGRHFAR